MEEIMKTRRPIGLIGIDELWIRICNIQCYSDTLPTYWISSYGRVYNEKRGFLVQTSSFDYLYAGVRAYNEIHGTYVRRIRVHRLVMLAFAYVNGCEELEVNHLDGNKWNNRIWNLEWSTRKDNMDHAVVNHLAASGENSYRATITNEQAIMICELLSTGEYLCTDISEMLNVPLSIVHSISSRSSWNMISENYVFRTRVSKVVPNSVLIEILDAMNVLFRSSFGSDLEYYRIVLDMIGFEYDDIYRYRMFMSNLMTDPDSYRGKLNNCEH